MNAALYIFIVVLIGWVVGMCAEVLLPGPAPRGFVRTTLIGVSGAIFGALAGRQLGWWHHGQVPGFFMSLLGAMLMLALYRALRRKAA